MSLKKDIEDAQKGNRQAQRSIYYATCDELMQTARRYCASSSDAKDILQEAYIKIFQNINQFDPLKGRFAHWVKKIVINESLMQLRKKNRLSFHELDAGPIVITEDFLDAMTVEELRDCIHQMSTQHKVILNLYFFDQLSHREISEILQIKESSSRSRLTRAKANLKKQWQSLHKFKANG